MSINSLKFVEKISKCIYSHKTVNNTKYLIYLKIQLFRLEKLYILSKQ